MRILLIISLILFSGRSFAQGSTDQQLAVHYFQNGEFEKAHMYYEKLYNASPTSFYYKYYLRCKIEIKDYKEAERLIRKHQKREEYNLTLYLDLAEVLTLQGDEKKAEAELERAIKNLEANYTQISQLGEAFKTQNKIDQALRTYEKGEVLLGGANQFATQRAELYAMKGEYNKMITIYFDLLDFNPSYVGLVQGSLVSIVNFEDPNDSKGELLKGEILKRVQKDPNNQSYVEMLIWFFQQRGDFQAAFTQIKAIDKRLKLEGMKVIEFASICINNEQYDIAAKSYDYVVQMGSNSPYYFVAQTGLIDVLYKKVVAKGFYTNEELVTLETNCVKIIREHNNEAESAGLKLKLAHLQAFYLHKNQEAIDSLLILIEEPGITLAQQAEAKMELADILLLTGNKWDASLYYSQVEKAYKHDVLGHEAKFRNARVFYYGHDYKWAQSQLDVLKTSTSKLISNDALELSLKITENLGLDSIAEPLDLFSDAELLMYQNKDDEALKKLDSLNTQFTWHTLADDVLYLRYRIAKKHNDYDRAKAYLEEIITKFPTDILGDNAIYELAEMYQYHYKDNEKAADLYKKIIFEYRGSLFEVDARKKFRMLRGENLN